MARDANGTYTLPAGNPVIGGTVIASGWANTTMDDIELALTDSLDRRGRGGMIAAFRFTDGVYNNPGAGWTNEPTTGFYRDEPGDLQTTLLSRPLMRWFDDTVWINKTGVDPLSPVWEEIVTASSGGEIPVTPGTVEGQTLYWDETIDKKWKPTTLLLQDIANATVLMTASPSGRAYAAAASTVAVIERSADTALSIISGNVNTGIINFGDTDAESPGSIEYDHLDSKMRLYNGSATPTVTVATGGFTGFGNDIPTAQVEASAIAGLTGLIRASQWGSNTSNHQARVKIQRSNSGVVGTFSGFLQANRVIGAIDFEPSDGTVFRTSASIIASTGGQQSASDTSSELQFWTTAIGSLTAQQRMVINPAGFLGVANPDPLRLVHIGSGAGTIGNASTYKLLIENNNDVVVQLRAPDANKSALYFGNPASFAGAAIERDGATEIFRIKSQGDIHFQTTGSSTVRMRILADGKVGVGITPEIPFQVEGAGFLGTTGVTGHNFIAFGSVAIQQAATDPGGITLTDYQMQAANITFNTAGFVRGLMTGTPSPSSSRFEVVAALPGGPDPDTIYFVTV